MSCMLNLPLSFILNHFDTTFLAISFDSMYLSNWILYSCFSLGKMIARVCFSSKYRNDFFAVSAIKISTFPFTVSFKNPALSKSSSVGLISAMFILVNGAPCLLYLSGKGALFQELITVSLFGKFSDSIKTICNVLLLYLSSNAGD